MKRDFSSVAAAALTRSEVLLAQWLPHGRKRGSEWVAINPTRDDKREGSFSVNLRTGRWADFAVGDRGGDLISLLAYLTGARQGDAAAEIARSLDLPWGRSSVSKRPRCSFPARSVTAELAKIPSQTSMPVDASGATRGSRSKPTSMPSDIVHSIRGSPSRVWSYHDAEGTVIGFVCRFVLPGGAKDVVPYSWCGSRWDWRAMPAPRALYALPQVLARPGAIVVIAEGEKAADAAQGLLPEAVITTWTGGCNAWTRTDFTPLRGRRVVLWPDADIPGKSAMASVQKHLLLDVGSSRVGLPELPAGLPKGFDAADLADHGLGREYALKLLAGAA